MDAEELLTQAKRAVGQNAYVMYPPTKRPLIPEAVVWGFASACLLEFVKPFFDFKGLGEVANKHVTGLLQAWRDKASFEEHCRTEGVDAAVLAALEAVPNNVTSDQSKKGVENLTSALKQIGVNEQDAAVLADKIKNAVAPAANTAAAKKS
ncbi:hypothetical protein [Bradyrhizobium sp. 2S1]|uniref:hypothetical protein n=1 Tax=Bradyrhizobium sp. 2S1 TaxID=1404429 RepID=UPI00140E2733|nr:hypothetical protein [Bradyrhizobium sp. 2S1]MCK7665025.1 hypothetical protein [Bradyrhizobium sp. 2S1]